jgi:MoxR-like ATPase
MKKSHAVKSLAAGLGALLCAGPAAAQVVAASSVRASLGGVAAAAGSVAVPSLGEASLAPLALVAPALSAPSIAVAAFAAAPLAAPALAPAAMPAASIPAAAAPAAGPAASSAAPEAKGLSALVGRLTSALRVGGDASPAATAAARSEGAISFDGGRALPAASVVAGEPGSASTEVPAAKPYSRGATPELQAQVTAKAELVRRLRAEIGKVIVGQAEMVDSIIMSLIASEHVLLEGVPGVAKTQAVKAAADSVSGDFKRIQGTPDKLPSDIIGAEILQDDLEHPGLKVIKVQFGPVFTNILLVDEINRMMPKTQSALLEAMAEGQVTIGNTTYKLAKPFLVIATQNPIEQEGTYRLPEAQQDRFMLKVSVPLPSTAELIEIMERFSSKDNQPKAEKVHSLAELDEIRRIADQVYVAPSLKSYIADLVEATSRPEKYGIELPKNAIEKDGGAGPRAAIYLLKAARVHALMDGRAWAGPEDIAAVAHRILRHRITLGFSAPRDLTTDKVVDAVLSRVPIPAR